MGTSTSCSGGKAGSPFDPEWLSPDTAGNTGASDSTDKESPSVPAHSNEKPENPDKAKNEAELAPKRRYAEAKRNISGHLAGKNNSSIKSAVKSMINKGMGGSRRAASTMRNTAQGVGTLGQFLSTVRDRSDSNVVNWVDRVRQGNLSADDLILELVQEVLPNTGSIDDESLRNAAANALGQLYEEVPNVDIFNLNDQQIHRVMAITIANEVCNRMDLQLGQIYEKLKYTPQQIQQYRNDVQEYVQAEVSVVMVRHSGGNMLPQKLAYEVLQSALEVFAS
ncbi:Qat anti-phage system associated protein QatB [Orbaceae bacterium ac157xtp]